jgi:hypothetical protein
MVLQNDQVIIAGQEVECNDLKNATHFAKDIVASQVEGGSKAGCRSSFGCAEKLLDLLKVTSLAVTTESLVQVKSHYPDVDMSTSGKAQK